MSRADWTAAVTKVCTAIALSSALACNEATLSLFPGQADVSPGPGDMPSQPEPVAGLVGHWPFDSDASDLVAGNDGALLGGATFVEDPLRGRVLRCNGTDAGVSIANRTPIDFSYAFWVWTDVPSEGDNPRVATPLLWSNVGGEPIDDFITALVDNHLVYLSYGQTATGSQNLVDATWHHVVVTRQESSSVLLYVDTRVDGDGSASSGTVTANPLVYVCANPDAGSHFSGAIDDLRLYDRALTASDVQRIYDETEL